MAQNTVFGEHMDDKGFCQLSRGNGVVHWNEDGLFCEAVHQDSSKTTRGRRKLFDEVYRDRIPRSDWNGKLLEESIRLVTFGLGA